MELILKITELCNFKCTYCSSSDILPDSAAANTQLDLKRVFEFLRRFPETKSIIVNGGDPLMVRPRYYWELIDFLDVNDLDARISFTSNLWPFYKNTELWLDLFKHPRMGVCTSFEYGGQRLIAKGKPYTEQHFRDVVAHFEENVGYKPDFISVINDDNEQHAIKNVELAKDLGVECKLNYAMASGRQSAPYQLSKIYKTYLEIIDRGLMPWEFNTKQMVRRLSGRATVCPQSRECDKGIRALNPGGDYYSCGSIADDKEMPIDFNAEVRLGDFFTPLQDSFEHKFLKSDCLSCPMFEICNGCRKTIVDMKRHGIVEEHCKLMKTLAPKIIDLNNEWADKSLIKIVEVPGGTGHGR